MSNNPKSESPPPPNNGQSELQQLKAKVSQLQHNCFLLLSCLDVVVVRSGGKLVLNPIEIMRARQHSSIHIQELKDGSVLLTKKQGRLSG